MQNLLLKILLIVVILAGCVWWIYPPQERIRLGKDLRGGVSLIYSVNFDDDARDRQEVLNQIIDVLQDRVNPQGVLDISMEPLGDDRIEIVMPLPSDEVQELRRQYERRLDDLLRAARIPAGELDSALRFDRAPEEFGGEPGSDRYIRLVSLQDAYNEMQEARAALRAARKEGADEETVFAREQEVADAEIEYEDLRRSVLQMSLERSRIVRAVGLSTEEEIVRGERGRPIRDADGEPRVLPSPREIELNEIREEFTDLVGLIDATVEAYDQYLARRTGLDDPEDLKRLLRGAGVLEYRIAVRTGAEDVNIDDLREQLRERGPEATDSPVARWFEINDLRQWYDTPEDLERLQLDARGYFQQTRDLVAQERDGRYFLLLYTTRDKSMTHEDPDRSWSVRSASRGLDSLGRTAVDFRLDPTGGTMMGRLTAPHVGEPMAIVLDAQVFSAPTLQSQIQRQGQITGNFSRENIDYLIRVLAAGALEARLGENPIAENTLGPSIGADNLRRGLQAFIVATIAVAIFMMLYYFFAGLVAVFALLANGLIIFGVMSLMDGTFTLPGLAGIVLTIGMAVDANVLIYERIREEIFEGEFDLRGSIRQGYNKALSTILDANITNLIVCFVLFRTATTEVKGFAMTLTIGIFATLFTCLFVTRVIYQVYTDVFKARKLAMLPTVIPAIHHFLEPNINWVGMRKMFWTGSVIAIICSVALVSSRGVDLFDTELRGGVAVTFATAESAENDAERIRLPHVGEGSVEQRVRAMGNVNIDAAATDEQRRRLRVLNEFSNASVLTVGETSTDERGRVVANRFQVKVPTPRGVGVADEDGVITRDVIRAIEEEFEGLLDIAPEMRFNGAGDENHSRYTFVIEQDELGASIGEPRLTEDVSDYRGGVAIVLRDLDPPSSLAEIRQRIDRMRGQPDFADARGRTVDVFGLEMADTDATGVRRFNAVVVAVYDPTLSFLTTNFDTWDQELAAMEWRLVTEALLQPPSLEQVASYSAAMARTLAAQAQMAVLLALLGILVYIWVRFGSLRYSGAAIAALVHDVTIALGVLALTAYLSRTFIGNLLLIDEFRIDLGVVAALLTIIGYSLNDTIVILDRIRENRGKVALPTAATVNRSINQTVSRTVLTSTTTLMAIVIMYIAGGTGIRSFAFTLMVGLVIGTYSSVAIAAPLVFERRPEKRDIPGEGEEGDLLGPDREEPAPA